MSPNSLLVYSYKLGKLVQYLNIHKNDQQRYICILYILTDGTIKNYSNSLHTKTHAHPELRLFVLYKSHFAKKYLT